MLGSVKRSFTGESASVLSISERTAVTFPPPHELQTGNTTIFPTERYMRPTASSIAKRRARIDAKSRKHRSLNSSVYPPSRQDSETAPETRKVVHQRVLLDSAKDLEWDRRSRCSHRIVNEWLDSLPVDFDPQELLECRKLSFEKTQSGKGWVIVTDHDATPKGPARPSFKEGLHNTYANGNWKDREIYVRSRKRNFVRYVSHVENTSREGDQENRRRPKRGLRLSHVLTFIFGVSTGAVLHLWN